MWGPWIEHDGTHRPVEKGEYVHAVGEYPDGEIIEKRFTVTTDAWAWYWINFGRRYGGVWVSRIVRYRVWKRPDDQVSPRVAEMAEAK